MSEVAAFFDVEGTLYTDNTWKALIRHRCDLFTKFSSPLNGSV